ncbi:hypothetical protein QJS66_05800 [Kocuria rhizophila]|nr:hypothetical protein QJS66_05800 [Kocuria rhizophila]
MSTVLRRPRKGARLVAEAYGPDHAPITPEAPLAAGPAPGRRMPPAPRVPC